MDGPMSISSLLGEREAPALNLAQCTVQLPGPSTEERDQYLAAQLARFEALEKWEDNRAAESMGAKAANYAAKWAHKAEIAAVQAFPHLEARAVSRVVKSEKPGAKQAAAQNNKRKNETPESTQKAKVAKTTKIPIPPKKMGQPEKQYKNTFEGIWRDIAKREIPKVYKLYQATITTKQTNDKKTAVLASKEARKWQYRTTKHVKAMQARARRAMREMMQYWKKTEKEERNQRKAAVKEKQEAAKREDEERENARQARKLNFLITQTELYSHFVSKVGGQDETEPETNGTSLKQLDFSSDEGLADAASHNAQRAVKEARERAAEFGEQVRNVDIDNAEINFQNPTSLGDVEISQPKLLDCQLKEYQIKGLNWLANLYEQGINGILADEMGLGKTVQSISVMAYLAEVHNIWGPFVVVAPASTLHNWHEEIKKFVPQFKVLPYWGSSKERTVLRRYWDRKQLRYTKDSEFHVLVTSYQLIVADAQYFNRIKWQYMILDEAQAIKSSSSSRWKALLAMQCRNRLLLTGTPIQNSMQELWALLHFIMPTLFDSHEEFSDWFSKDIESHATKNSQLNEQQLKRLHMILKPFMLRRVKKNVQKELGDKIEIDIMCPLTKRQRTMYQNLQSQISLSDLEGEDNANLMNLVMQFRKVCNHPDLFDRADFRSPLALGSYGNSISSITRAAQLDCSYTLRNHISMTVPKLVYRESLDIPSEGSDVFIQKKIERMLTVWDPQSETIKAASKLSGTPAGRVVALAQKGLFERALDTYDLAKSPAKFDIEVDPYLKSIEKIYYEPAAAPPIEIIGADRSLALDQQTAMFPPERLTLFRLTLDEELQCIKRGGSFPPSNLYPDNGRIGYSNMSMPSMRKFIMESGKLARLDTLLAELQANGHRVLIYFQMTKMMDLMEEYLSYKKYKFQRLDGGSKMEDRRDTVNDWQTTPDLFVFLLSTRAGGLGINLTAADTVIFYDSDWNPTIDSQAMDRAHRLGQTKQVTVYRLLVKGTIEQRMRDRAKQKEHVQQVVMEGGKAADFKNPGNKEVASWLLDDAPIGETNEN